MNERSNDNLRQAALDCHEFPKPGKLEIRTTKPKANGRDLARAYSPSVAEACLEIKADPAVATKYTARGIRVTEVSNGTAIAAVAVHRDEADSMICGTFWQYLWHLNYVNQVLGGPELHPIGALFLMFQEKGLLFIADTQVNPEPTPEQIADSVISVARHVKRLGLQPKIALCSHSQFGNLSTESGKRMRAALEILGAEKRDFDYEGEMHADSALDPELRARIFPNSRFDGVANVLIFVSADAASAVRNVLKISAGGLEVGPILMGIDNKAHIVTPSITARGLLNIAVLAEMPVQHYG